MPKNGKKFTAAQRKMIIRINRNINLAEYLWVKDYYDEIKPNMYDRKHYIEIIHRDTGNVITLCE